MDTTTEIRDPQGGRNFIRSGDTVKVTLPGKRSFFATFRKAILIDGDIDYVEVYGAPKGKCPAARCIRPETIHRIAQTKGGQRREVVR